MWKLRYVMEIVHQQVAKEQLPIIKMEIDYELLTLYDAIQEKDEVQIKVSKERLKQLRLKWLQIENV